MLLLADYAELTAISGFVIGILILCNRAIYIYREDLMTPR
jgi:hypothetical protein